MPAWMSGLTSTSSIAPTVSMSPWLYMVSIAICSAASASASVATTTSSTPMAGIYEIISQCNKLSHCIIFQNITIIMIKQYCLKHLEHFYRRLHTAKII